MKVYILLSMTILMLAVTGCGKEDPKEEDTGMKFQDTDLLGSWNATINQPGFGDFTGDITITRIEVGKEAATGSYGSPPCDFLWMYNGSSADRKNFIFKETITEEYSDCVSGTVHLTFKDKDNLIYSWAGDDAPAYNFATGLLKRK